MSIALKSFGSSLALLVCLAPLTGCDMAKDWLEKKGNEALQEELKKDAEKNAKSDDDGDKKSKGDKAGDTSTPSGDVWTTGSGDKVKLTRTDLSSGAMSGFTMLAPEGSKVTATLGGRGADINEFNHGFSVWVREDPTATLDLMKEAVKVLHMDAKLSDEDKNSFIVQSKSLDGNAIYHYYGLLQADGKKVVCQTQTSNEAQEKSLAQQVDKLCESLELNGKAIGATTPEKTASNEEKQEDASAPEKTAENTPATLPAKADAPTKSGAPTKSDAPAKPEPAKTAAAPAPAPATPAAAPPAKEGGLTLPGKRTKATPTKKKG